MTNRTDNPTAEQVAPGNYAYELDIDVPTTLDCGGYLKDTMTRRVDGTLTVDRDSNVTTDQLRQWLVNEVATDLRGKTVTVTRFALTRAGS